MHIVTIGRRISSNAAAVFLAYVSELIAHAAVHAVDQHI